MADHLEASITLPSEPASAREARTFVGDTLRAWGLPDGTETADGVRLIISELATNVVQHTRGQSPTFTVDLVLVRDEELRIGVTDSLPRLGVGAGRPRRPGRLGGAQRDGGRGLQIVRHLTAESGGRLRVEPSPDGGKTVRVVLPWIGCPAMTGALPNRFVATDRASTGARPTDA